MGENKIASNLNILFGSNLFKDNNFIKIYNLLGIHSNISDLTPPPPASPSASAAPVAASSTTLTTLTTEPPSPSLAPLLASSTTSTEPPTPLTDDIFKTYIKNVSINLNKGNSKNIIYQYLVI
jgi:hypothetical protein